MESVMTLWIPQSTPLFATNALVDLTGTATISIWLVAVSSIIAEFRVLWAVLPADWANSGVTVLAVRIAKSSILLLVSWAGRKRLSSGAAVSLFPA